MSDCGSSHCVTCSDHAVPLRVIELGRETTVICEQNVEVMTDLVGDVGVGDLLLVHAGVALAKVET